MYAAILAASEEFAFGFTFIEFVVGAIVLAAVAYVCFRLIGK